MPFNRRRTRWRSADSHGIRNAGQACWDEGYRATLPRLGFAVTYNSGSGGRLLDEQTVSGAGLVPGQPVYRLVLRATRKLF